MSTPPKTTYLTFGCKVNQYESQAIRERLEQNGLLTVGADEDASVIVVNTCTVTDTAAREGLRAVRRAIRNNPDAHVVVTGCAADSHRELLDEIDGVTAVLGNREKDEVIARLTPHLPEGTFDAADPETSRPFTTAGISRFDGHNRAFLKVQDGCSLRCTYCIIPQVRGRSISRPLDDCVEEARRLVDNGYVELVLTGVHLGGWGRDLPGRPPFRTLLAELSKIPGLGRIRLSSIEVAEMSIDEVRYISEAEKVCPHIHLPLQSGDETVLRRMNRPYTLNMFMEKVEEIYSLIDRPALTTDIIVGFPGETEEQFLNTLKSARSIGFSRIHVFPFSVRSGTPAAEAMREEHLSKDVIRDRVERLNAVDAELTAAYYQQFAGDEVDLLVESKIDIERNCLTGYTERYIRSRLPLDYQDRVGRIVRCRVTDVHPDHVMVEPNRKGI
jgi:threonylcarbamoyladenosine tRNA methylthiotransferase MtaB